jgi:hypothetical protein
VISAHGQRLVLKDHSAKSIGDRDHVRPNQPMQIGVLDLLPD